MRLWLLFVSRPPLTRKKFDLQNSVSVLRHVKSDLDIIQQQLGLTVCCDLLSVLWFRPIGPWPVVRRTIPIERHVFVKVCTNDFRFGHQYDGGRTLGFLCKLKHGVSEHNHKALFPSDFIRHETTTSERLPAWLAKVHRTFATGWNIKGRRVSNGPATHRKRQGVWQLKLTVVANDDLTCPCVLRWIFYISCH